MRIGIIGAGSIGLLFAAYLSETCDVTVFTRTKEQAEEINRNGIILIKGGLQVKTRVKAIEAVEWAGLEDLTIVTVKQYQLEPIINKFSSYTEKSLNILFLQNGMGHLEALHRLQNHHIFAGSVEHGAVKENACTVRHNGAGVTNAAVFRGEPAALVSFISAAPEGFPVRWNDHYYGMLLHKLIVNAVINPLTAILQVPNGMLIKNDFYFKVLTDLFAEISDILNLDDSESYFQKVIEVCRITADNRSSMLKDIECGRKTEVDAILGFLLKKAKQQGKKTPLLQNCYFIVKGKENENNC